MPRFFAPFVMLVSGLVCGCATVTRHDPEDASAAGDHPVQASASAVEALSADVDATRTELDTSSEEAASQPEPSSNVQSVTPVAYQQTEPTRFETNSTILSVDAAKTSDDPQGPVEPVADESSRDQKTERQNEAANDTQSSTPTEDPTDSLPDLPPIEFGDLLKPRNTPLPKEVTNFANFDFAASGPTLRLEEVAASVHRAYPMLEAAYLEATMANGYQLAAWGSFDTKLKADSGNGPAGFYQTYRQKFGFEQPIYDGGHFFGGYRIGRGDFQPWYLERQTNDGGELKAGVRVPLIRNREIDQRRAELWRATYDRQRVQPEIRAQLILFVRDASVAYWDWIAAGRRVTIGRRALEVSIERNARLERMVELGALDPPTLQDNQRSIAQREAKLIDRQRKLEQTAVKLSLYFRDEQGEPVVPQSSRLSDFGNPAPVEDAVLTQGVQTALAQRPELAALEALYRSVNVDLAEARNEYLPALDAELAGSQDVGEATSKKKDKSRFEVEAGLYFDMPLQRRKARGKTQVAQAKLRQVAVKQRFTQDKIVAEVRAVYVALAAAQERLEKAQENRKLAIFMAEVENRKFELGQTDLLSVYLRERAAIEAADQEVDTFLEYYISRADYDAVLARDWPDVADVPGVPPEPAPVAPAPVPAPAP